MNQNSCVMALSPELRTTMGLADPANPVVHVRVTLHAQGDDIEIHPGSTVDARVLKKWVLGIPPDLRRGLDDRTFTLEITNEAGRPYARVLENDIDSFDAQVREFAEPLIARLRAYFLNLREVVRRLPPLDELRTHLELVARMRIRLELELDRQDRLEHCNWGVFVCCGQHDAGKTPEELVADSRLYDEVREENIVAAMSEGTFKLRLPIVTPTSCHPQTNADRMIEIIQALAAEALVKDMMPRLYAELGLEHKSRNSRPRAALELLRSPDVLLIVIPRGRMGSA